MDAISIIMISSRLVQWETQRSSHKIFIKAKSLSIENKIHTYRVSDRKYRNRHEPLKQFGPKLQPK